MYHHPGQDRRYTLDDLEDSSNFSWDGNEEHTLGFDGEHVCNPAYDFDGVCDDSETKPSWMFHLGEDE
jgi:hypothetical protein